MFGHQQKLEVTVSFFKKLFGKKIQTTESNNALLSKLRTLPDNDL